MSSPKVKNVARSVRERLGLTQVEFANEVGLSYASVQNYDRGVPPSPGARQRIAELAEQHGLGDLVDDWIADREERSVVPVTIPRAPEDQKWVDLLVEVLHSGHTMAINAVTQDLVAFSKLVRVDTARPGSRERRRGRAGGSGRRVSP